MYKNLIWDFDGTLFDTYPEMSNVFKKALEELNIVENGDIILQKLKISVTHAITYFATKYALKDNQLSDIYNRLENSIEEAKACPFPHVKVICELVINSGGKNFVFTHRGVSTLRFLKHHSMSELFTDIVTKEHGFKKKPDPEGFLSIINKYKLNKESTLAVGDRELDLLAAKKAGIKACLFSSNELRHSVAADYIIDSFEELRKLIY